MKKVLSIVSLIIFICSTICFAIRTRLIYNVGYFCDEYNFSPADINGGNLYMMLGWAEWALLALICLISLVVFIFSLLKGKYL